MSHHLRFSQATAAWYNPWRGTMTDARRLILHELHQQAGASFAPWQGWTMPVRFRNVEEEYRAVRQRAGLIDWSAWGMIEVRGADRIAFLHQLLTNHIKALRPGSGCEAALLTPSAKLLTDLLVLADTDTHWLIAPRFRTQTLLEQLNRYLITEDVTLVDRGDAFALLAVQGPASFEIGHRMLGEPIPVRQPLEHARVSFKTVPLRLFAYSLTGERGFGIMVPVERAAGIWSLALESGASSDLMPVGWEALNVLRLEAGIPWYGIDMDESFLLPEAGLTERLTSSTKGCYVGQEILARLQTYGSLSRKLVGVVCHGQTTPARLTPLTKGGQTVGEITSACRSPALAKPIALAYVKRPFYEVGTQVVLALGGEEQPAELVALPFLPIPSNRANALGPSASIRP